jgi:hypothetical protein
MERSTAQGRLQQWSTCLTERGGCIIESPLGGNRSGRAVVLQVHQTRKRQKPF